MPSPGNQFLSDEFGDIEDYFISDVTLIDQYIGDTLFDWGSNANGQLGLNNVTSPICTPVTTFAGGTNWKQVSCGTHTVAIKTDGTLWTWGLNDLGQLGDNTIVNRSTPVTTFVGGTNWKSVDCTSKHTSAIKTDGTLWTWGRNSYGQIGDNTGVNRSTPVTTFSGGTNWKSVASGFNHTSAIKTDGTLWTWGRNISGQLGTNDTTNRSTPVTTFIGGTNWKQVDCGNQTGAIKTDGTLWNWGSNLNGVLGINDTTNRLTPVTTFAGRNNWKQISANVHLAAIKTDGTLWTWGDNAYGQIGDNTSTDRLTPVTTFAGGTNWKSISAGDVSIGAIKTDGTLWNWGDNTSGQLGINVAAATGANSSRATPVTTIIGGTNWKQVSLGNYTSRAVKSGLTVDLS